MNYAELPLDERIRMASDYALLLIEDSLTEDNIVTGLQSQFFLTQEQALLALSRTKTVHKEEYNQSLNASIYKAVAALAVCIASGIFYIAAGDELGIVPLLVGAFFLLAAFGTFGAVIQKILDKFFYSPSLIEKRLSNKAKKDAPQQDWTVGLFMLSVVALAAATVVNIKKSGYEEIEKLITLHGLQIKEPPVRQNTGSKGHHYFYSFRFTNYPNEFRFAETRYRFAGENFQPQKFETGDTLSIQVYPKDYYSKLYDGFDNGEVAVVNIIRNNKPVVNLALRNKDLLAHNKTLFTIALSASIILLILMVLRHKRAADRDKESGFLTSPTGYT